MIQLHETIMGKRLIEGTLPDIAHQLERIADSLEKLVEKQNADPETERMESINFHNSVCKDPEEEPWDEAGRIIKKF